MPAGEVTIVVYADTTAAEAALDELEAQIDRINAKLPLSAVEVIERTVVIDTVIVDERP